MNLNSSSNPFPTEGICDTCGEDASRIDGFICEVCEGLQETSRAARREEGEMLDLERHHSELSMSTRGIESSKHIALARRYAAQARYAELRRLEALKCLEVRELAYVEKLDIGVRGAA